MKRLALVTVGLLALAAPALADVGAGAVKAGTYKGKTSQTGVAAQNRTVQFGFSGRTLHSVVIHYKIGCQSGHFIANATNISALGPINGKHASFTPTGSGRFNFGNGTVGTFRLTDHVTVKFPNKHTVAGTFTTTWQIFNPAGSKADTCTMSTASWSATRQ
jgi:hypothetical protein